jgi:hypothetical protein
MSTNGLKAYNRLVWEPTPLLGTIASPATLLSAGTTVHIPGLLGFSAIVLAVQYIRNGGAATSVDLTMSLNCPGNPTVDFKVTADVFDTSGTGTRAPYKDSYAVSADDAYWAVIPVTGGDNGKLTIKAPAATTDQCVIYMARAS